MPSNPALPPTKPALEDTTEVAHGLVKARANATVAQCPREQ